MLARLFTRISQQHFWGLINNNASNGLSKSKSANKSDIFLQGLFGNFLLQTPKGFELLTEVVQKRTIQLVNEIVHKFDSRTADPKQKTTVQLLDDLSNEICSAADLTDCVRCMHPDPEYIKSAEKSMQFFTCLVETLNTTPELYNTLKKSLQTEVNRLDHVSERTARLLLEDFEQSGVLLGEFEREKFVELSSEVFDVGTKFVMGCDHSVKLSANERKACLYDGDELNTTWTHSSDHKIRQFTYKKYYEHHSEQETLLKRLIDARHQIAQLTNFPTFAHRAQNNSILCTYENVHQFLQNIIQEFAPLIDVELEQIRHLVSKYSQNFDLHTDRIGLADVEFATMIRRQQLMDSIGLNPSNLSAHFHFYTILEGFQSLIQHLYGLNFKYSLPNEGECWPGNVLKLDVYRDDNQEFLGTIFLDLDARATKLQGDCHFTIRCSKLLDNGEYQTPIVVVSLSFIPEKLQYHSNSPWDIVQKAKVSPQQAENFFHEMGHAFHSILGRTKFQHVSGTRCATDFAEVPSHLMECFFNDFRILQMICRDKSGRSMDEEQARKIVQLKYVFPALHTMQQTIYSLFDLELHGERAEDITRGRITTTDLFGELNQRALPQLERNKDYAYHQRFSHLVTYGAKYYSYLIARASALLIYDHLFAIDPLSRKNGQQWAKVQSHGGEYASHTLLAEALNAAAPGATELSKVLIVREK